MLVFDLLLVLMFRKIKYSDKELLADILLGGKAEDKAITYLIKKNWEKVRQFVTTRNGKLEDAEDVLQEGITELLLNVRKKRFKGESAISTYLFAICKNIWYKKFQKQDKAALFKSEYSTETIGKNTPEILFIDEEQKANILALFDHLKAKCKEVLYLWGLNYSMKEIAKKLNYSSEQVAMNKKNLCLKELHQRLTTDKALIKIKNELL